MAEGNGLLNRRSVLNATASSNLALSADDDLVFSCKVIFRYINTDLEIHKNLHINRLYKLIKNNTIQNIGTDN